MARYSFVDAPKSRFSFVEPEEDQGRGLGETAADYARSLLSGSISVPKVVVGLADLAATPFRDEGDPTFTERLANIGVDFARAQSIIRGDGGEVPYFTKSDGSRDERAEVNEAFQSGVLDGLGAIADNPSVAMEAALESVPAMLTLAGATRLAALRIYGNAAKAAAAGGATGAAIQEAGKQAVTQAMPRLAALSAGLEGGQAAGEQAADLASRGELDGKGALASLGTGVTTAGVGLISNKLAPKIGLGDDVEAAIATTGLRDRSAGLLKSAAQGAIREGFLEEAPQSALEQGWSNIANDRPYTEGMPQAATEGGLAGFMLGGAGGGFSSLGARSETINDTLPNATPDQVMREFQAQYDAAVQAGRADLAEQVRADAETYRTANGLNAASFRASDPLQAADDIISQASFEARERGGDNLDAALAEANAAASILPDAVRDSVRLNPSLDPIYQQGDLSASTDILTERQELPRLGFDNVIYGEAPAPSPDLERARESTRIALEGESPRGTPVERWTGRSGNGYPTLGMAERGLEGRKKAQPELEWDVEQMPSGRYQVVGYAPDNDFAPLSPETFVADANVDMLQDATRPLRETLPTETPGESRTDYTVMEVPVSELRLSEDIPQFKSGANERGVVEPLEGQYDRRGVGPIQVWERADGTREVISGRHRFDLAQRTGEETIPAQVYREADGFTAQQAATLDAELNIRDGQGQVADYVQYFQTAEISQEEAESRGILARATGQRAYTLASKGDAELLAAHRNGAVSDEAAVSIANAAPNNGKLQAVGIRAIQEGKSNAVAANMIHAVKTMAGGDSSLDMFGFDSAAMQEAERMAREASSRQRDLSRRINAVQGAAKNPEAARAEGVNVRSPKAVLKKVEELKAERARWDNWSSDPELVAQLRGVDEQQNDASVADEPQDDLTADAFAQDDRTVDAFAQERSDPGQDGTDQGDLPAPEQSGELYFDRARELLEEQRNADPLNKRAMGGLKRKVRALAKKVPASDEKTVLAIDTVSTRLDMENLEFAPARVQDAFALTQETETDRQAREQSEAETRDAAAQQAREAEQRAQADAEVDQFTLTGSDRMADVMAAGGQGDLLGAVASDPPGDAQPFNSEAWNQERDDRIAESRAAGNRHLDQLDANVESMRSKEVYYVHDPKVRGTVRTVDRYGNVYINWADEYSAERELASEVRDGRKTVYQSSLGKADLKDYVVGKPPAAGPAATGTAGTTELSAPVKQSQIEWVRTGSKADGITINARITVDGGQSTYAFIEDRGGEAGGSRYQVDGEYFASLKEAKARAVDVVNSRLREDGYLAKDEVRPRNPADMTRREFYQAIENAPSDRFVTSRQEDWGTGKARGQGKRSGGMVMGGMGDAPQGVKTYTSIAGGVPDYEQNKLEIEGLRRDEQAHYAKARAAGFDHDTAMLAVYERQDGSIDAYALAADRDTLAATSATPITQPDVDAAESLLATQVETRLGKMKAAEVQKMAAAYYKSMGEKPPVGKARIIADITDFSKHNPIAVAGAAGVTPTESMSRAFDAKMQGLVDRGAVDEATGLTNQPAPLEDWGEEIKGARKSQSKSLSKEMTDEDIANSTLSKIWPKSEVDAVEDTDVAAFLFAARSEIPNKPRRGVGRWVEKVKIMRGLGKAVESNPERAYEMARDPKYRLEGFMDKVDLLRRIDRSQWGRIGKVQSYPEAYRYEGTGPDAKKVRSPMVSVQIDKRTKRYQGEGLDAVIEQVQSDLGNEVKAKGIGFEIRGYRGSDEWFIIKKGDSEYRPLKSFTGEGALDDAKAFLKDNRADLEAAWEEVKARDNVRKTDVRNEENRPRTGEDYRQGRDATPEMFDEAFGFRGVQFGEWVKQGKNPQERQRMLNESFDALHDLAGILNIPTKAISLNGELGLAFGARGSGRASAHYEPGEVVINLTKTRGAGTLAHEWFHALDNYFQKKRGTGAGREGSFITYAPETYYVNQKNGQRLPAADYEPMAEGGRGRRGQKFVKSRFNPDDWKKVEGVRPEVAQSFAQLVEALDKSPMSQRSALMDKSRDGYWSRIIERAARSFENYVIAKMQDKGYDNDFLANVKAFEDWGQKNPGRYPYLKDDELGPVVEAFDNLFSTIETRETGRGVELYSTVAKVAGDEVTSIDSDPVVAARTYYQKNIQGNTVNRPEIGDVRFSGKGWHKLKRGLPTDIMRVKLIPAIPDVIRNGQYHGREVVEGRSDDIVAFHFFDGYANIGETQVQVGVTVGEDSKGNLFYNLNHDADKLWAKRKGPKQSPGPFSVSSRSEARLTTTKSLEELDAGVNIAILGRRLRNTRTPAQVRADIAPLFGGAAPALEQAGLLRIIESGELTPDVLTGLKSIKAWHGSPHRFDRFDFSKIGTGEGAQAYGHGGYFADARGVGEIYRNELSATSRTFFEPVSPEANARYRDAVDFADAAPVMASEMISLLPESDRTAESAARILREQASKPSVNADYANAYQTMADMLDSGDLVLDIPEGALYEVTINADPEQMLDWDKPVGDDVLRRIAENDIAAGVFDGDIDEAIELMREYGADTSGARLYTGMEAQRGGPAQAAKALREAGIPGIRYLDGMSRGYTVQGFYDGKPADAPRTFATKAEADSVAEEYRSSGLDPVFNEAKTYNYVIFDDSLIEIDAVYSKNGDIQAYVKDGVVTLVADNIDPDTDLSGLLMHEVGTHLMRLGKSDKDFQAIQRQFEVMAKNSDRAKAAMDRVPKDTPDAVRLEEAIGYFVEDNPNLSFSQKVLSWVRAKIKQWLGGVQGFDRSRLMKWANNLTESDLIYMAQSAVRQSRHKAEAQMREGLMASLRNDNDEPMAAFRRVADTPAVGNALYDELDFLQPDMTADEFMDALAEEQVSPEARRLLQALDNEGWLGFDGPSQALDALMREDADQFDLSPSLKGALGRYANLSGAAFSRRRISKAAGADSDNILFSRRIPKDPELERISRNVLAEPQGQTLRGKVQRVLTDRFPTSGLAWKQGVVDEFASISALERQANEGSLLDASESAYKFAAVSKNTHAMLAAAMDIGALEYRSGGIEIKDGSKGLVEILKPVADQGLLREWELWAGAKRAQRLMLEGRENNYTPTDIATVMARVQGEKKALFEQVQREWTNFNKSMLDLMEASGLINEDQRAIWEKDDYVPFNRVSEFGEQESGPYTKRGLSGQKSNIQKLEGGVEKISIVESMVRNAAYMVDASVKNIAMQRTINLVEEMGLAEEVTNVAIPDEVAAQKLRDAGIEFAADQLPAWKALLARHEKQQGTVAVSVNGEMKRYMVDDPLIVQAVTGLGADTVSAWMKVFSLPKHVLTTLITSEPSFALRNFIRDTGSTWVAVDVGKRNPLSGAVKGVIQSWRNDNVKNAMAAMGVGQGSFYDTRPENVRGHLDRLAGKGRIINGLPQLWEWYREKLGATEDANRIAVYEAALKNGASQAEAAYQAMDVLNFSRRGDFKIMQFLTGAVPFMNARIQGLEKLHRGAKEGTDAWYKMNGAFAMKGAMMTGATLALLASNWDNEDYWDLQEWERDTYYHFWIDGEHLRLPKPFEVGAVFSTIPERLFEQMRDDADLKLLGGRMLRMFADTLALDPTPQLFRPAKEVMANRNSFTGRDIVSFGQSQNDPEAQYSPFTSKTFVELADMMPDSAPEWMRSPAKLEHLYRGYLGTLGGYVLMGSDRLLREMTDSPERPALRAQDIPVINSYYRDGVSSNKQVGRVYDMARDANQAFNAIRTFRESGDYEKAQDKTESNKTKLRARRALNQVTNQMSKLSGAMRQVYDDPNMTAEQKRNRLDMLTKRRNQIAKRASERFYGTIE